MAHPAYASAHTHLIAEFNKLADTSMSLLALQQQIVSMIAQHLPYCNWTGFYMLDPADPDTLVLGPFNGAATPHVRIPVSEGICGAAVATGSTVIVDDVAADPRYLSCSIETKSEIVVPIHANGHIIGEIDIDSHTPAAFSRADRSFLEAAARIVGTYIESGRSTSPVSPAASK